MKNNYVQNTTHNIRLCKANPTQNRGWVHVFWKDSSSFSTSPTQNRGWVHVFWKDSSSFSTSRTRRVTLAMNIVISHKWGYNGNVITTNKTGHIRGHLWQIFRTVNQVIVASVKLRSDDFNRTARNHWFSFFSLLEAFLYQRNHDMNHIRYTYFTINVYIISTFKVLGTRLSNNHKLSNFDK